MRRFGCFLVILPALSAALYGLVTAQAEFAVSDQVVHGSLLSFVVGLVMVIRGKGPLFGPVLTGAGCAGLLLALPGSFLVLQGVYQTAPAREIALHGGEGGLYRVTDFHPTGLRLRVTRPSRGNDEEFSLAGLAAPDGTDLLLRLEPGQPLPSEVVGRVMSFHEAQVFRALAQSQNPRSKVPTAHILEHASLGWARVAFVAGWVLVGCGIALFLALGYLWKRQATVQT